MQLQIKELIPGDKIVHDGKGLTVSSLRPSVEYDGFYFVQCWSQIYMFPADLSVEVERDAPKTKITKAKT
jgi:hypothetical protein